MRPAVRKKRILYAIKAGLFDRLASPQCRASIVNGDLIVFYAINWFVVVMLLALWSLTAWAMHALAVWTVSNAGVWSGAASGVGGLRLPDWLAPWVPPEIAQSLDTLLSGLGPVVESLLQAAPAVAGGLGVATWAVWGIGSALLVLLGAGLHLLIALWRRRGGSDGSHSARALPTG
jgi:hypothetical protein